jgi:hypothetical protein
MLKTMKQTILAASMAVAFSSTAFAAEQSYKYEGDTYKLDVANGVISSEYCEKDAECKKSSVKVDELQGKLEKRVELLKKEVSDEKALLAKIEKQATGPDAMIINDEAANQKYVMVSIDDYFSTALRKEDADKGDFSLVPKVMKAEVERFERAITMLESGKVPEGGDFKDYEKISPVMELENLVRFSEYM